MRIKIVNGRWMKVELLGLAAAVLVACATGVDPVRPAGEGGAGGAPGPSTTSDFVGPSSSNTTGDFTTSTTSSAVSSSAASSSAASSSAASSSAASSSSASSSSAASSSAASSSAASSSSGGVVMGLALQYKAADTNATDNQMKPHFRVVNGGTSSVALTSLTIRYYFTAEGNPPQIFECDYAMVGCGNLAGVYATTTGAMADHYLEVSFKAGAGSVAPGANSGEIQARLHNQDYSNVNEANDYSFDPTKTVFTDWEKVTLYQDGALVWGDGALSRRSFHHFEVSFMRNAKNVIIPACSLILAACSAGGGGDKHTGTQSGAGGAGGSLFSTAGSGGTGGFIDPGPGCGPCDDFPAAPIFDAAGAPPPGNSPALFGDASNSSGSGGPCLIEPPIGALFPRNWVRPRFRFTAPAGQNLFEIRIHADIETHDLVVYTTNSQWTMPKELWVKLTAHAADVPITITVRSLDMNAPGKPLLGSTGAITIAPVSADGTMVYWAAIGEQPADAWLAGFAVGDESVITALEVNQVKEGGRKDQGGNPRGDGSVTCIGCHTSTPDGEAVVFTDHWPWGNAVASIKKETVGQVPAYVTAGAQETMNQPWLGAASFSKKHFTAGDRIYVTSYGRNSDQIWDGSTVSDQPNARLAWINLETTNPAGPTNGAGLTAAKGTAWGILERTGDTRGAMLPSWSHNGQDIVYVSTNAGKDGRLGPGAADLYKIPYNNKAGGTATPVTGAADPAYNEYYPSYSPDDAFVAFNRIPNGQDMYYNSSSEVYVIPAGGGTPTRLAANDAPECSGIKSPGITNSWPKWSPEISVSGGRSYYWMIFSSTRDGYTIQKKPTGKASQLYMTAIVVQDGKITTYPGVYLWNQPTNTSNNTPAWDVFQIPPVPPPK